MGATKLKIQLPSTPVSEATDRRLQNSGGHPGIVGAGGLPFETPDELPDVLEQLVSELGERRAAIAAPLSTRLPDPYLEVLEGAAAHNRFRTTRSRQPGTRATLSGNVPLRFGAALASLAILLLLLALIPESLGSKPIDIF